MVNSYVTGERSPSVLNNSGALEILCFCFIVSSCTKCWHFLQRCDLLSLPIVNKIVMVFPKAPIFLIFTAISLCFWRMPSIYNSLDIFEKRSNCLQEILSIYRCPPTAYHQVFLSWITFPKICLETYLCPPPASRGELFYLITLYFSYPRNLSLSSSCNILKNVLKNSVASYWESSSNMILCASHESVDICFWISIQLFNCKPRRLSLSTANTRPLFIRKLERIYLGKHSRSTSLHTKHENRIFKKIYQTIQGML